MSKYREAVLALTPKDLKIKDYFLLPGKSVNAESLASPGVTPMVFSFKRKEYVAAAGPDGRVYVLDATSLGGTNHKTPVFQSEAIASRSKNYDGNGFRGSFSTWNDVDSQNRWVYVPVSGPFERSAKLPLTGPAPSAGSILALKMDGQKDQPTLEPLWISAEIPSPSPSSLRMASFSPSRPANHRASPRRTASHIQWPNATRWRAMPSCTVSML